MEKVNFNEVMPEEILEHTSKGDQPKWHIENSWYKADQMGSESLSEIVISRLLEKSNLESWIRYYPVCITRKNKEITGCYSHNFLSSHESLIPLEKLHRSHMGTGLASALTQFDETIEKIRYTVDFVEDATGLEHFGEYLTSIMELDAFFLNEDRHTNNLAVIRDESTGRYRLCPLFDHGLSLLSDWNDYPVSSDIYHCIDQVHAKPFSSDFLEQMESAEILYRNQLKFTFTHEDVTQILKDLEEYYPAELRSRTEQIIFEQMRKYKIFF